MRNRHYWFKITASVLSIGYTALLIYAVFFARRRRAADIRIVHLMPFKNTVRDFRRMRLNEISVFNYYSNIFGNLLIFMPMAFILAYFFRIKKDWQIILAGAVISCGIELLQYAFHVGIADVDDVILNTVGTALGLLVYRLCEQELAQRKWLVAEY